jgi:acid stress-induced BolA-like protein IbaG/YrbA
VAIELDAVRELILEALPGAEVEVTDDTGEGDHLRAIVRAPQFVDLSRVEQHRLVKAAVQERMDDGSIHALSVKTTPAAPGGASGEAGAGEGESVTSEMDAETPPE